MPQGETTAFCTHVYLQSLASENEGSGFEDKCPRVPLLSQSDLDNTKGETARPSNRITRLIFSDVRSDAVHYRRILTTRNIFMALLIFHFVKCLAPDDWLC